MGKCSLDMLLIPPSGECVRHLSVNRNSNSRDTHTRSVHHSKMVEFETSTNGWVSELKPRNTPACISKDMQFVNIEQREKARLRGSIKNESITSHNHLPGSGIVAHGLSGSKIPFCTSSSRLARTDILRSRAARTRTHTRTRTHAHTEWEKRNTSNKRNKMLLI